MFNRVLELLLVFIVCAKGSSVKVWGPGLDPHKIIMPARYFFIEASNNETVLNLKDLEIAVEGSTDLQKPCRIWTNILDRKDNTFIVRYKVYEVCTHLIIKVKYRNKNIKESPYIINEAVYPDDCSCADKNVEEFVKVWQCGQPQNNLFTHFKTINWDLLRPKVSSNYLHVINQFDKPHSVSLCHYIIKDNQVFRKCYGKYVGFNMFSDSILLSLTRKVLVPDVEFFVNLGDWPLSTQSVKYPIFSWCGSSDSFDIVMPNYELIESSLENMGRVMLDMLSVQGNVDLSWEKRHAQLFWRGRDSNRQRLNLIALARKYPHLFNASLTNFFFYREEEDVYGPKSDHVSFFKFFEYKYQLAIDGTVAPYRMPFLLGGGSLIFKPQSKYFEHFYHNLQPYIHYVPVKEDLSDLVAKIEWAIENDKEAKVIAVNGQQFANENLLPQHVFCYYVHLLHEFSKVVTSKVKIQADMEIVKQKSSLCICNSSLKAKDEL